MEYDRGTETLATLVLKLRGYEGGLSGVPFRALLLVTDSPSRLEALVVPFGRRASCGIFWGASVTS